MQMIEFLINFFTEWLEIHSSFYRIFQIFKKYLNFKIKMSNLIIIIFEILIFQISNLKIA
jgi:hypothetical protein